MSYTPNIIIYEIKVR